MAKEAMTLKRLFNAGMINEQSDIQLIRMRIEKDPIDGLELIVEAPSVNIAGKFWEARINPYWETPIQAFNWYPSGSIRARLEPEIVYTDGNGEAAEDGEYMNERMEEQDV